MKHFQDGLLRRGGTLFLVLGLQLVVALPAMAVRINGTEFDHAGTLRSLDIASCGVWINTGTFMKPGADRSLSWTEDSSGPLADLAYTITSFDINYVNHIDDQKLAVINKINPNNRTPTNPRGGVVTIKGRYKGQEVTLLTGTVTNDPINEFSHRGYFSKDPKTGTWSCGTVLCQSNLITLDMLVNVTGGVFRNLFTQFFLEGRFTTARTFGDDFEARGAFSLFLPEREASKPVPEPATLSLLLGAGVGAVRLRRLRAEKSAIEEDE